MEKKIYGVARISTPKQKLERQVRNILNVYPDAYVIQIKYTGTTFKGNKQMENLVCQIKKDVNDNKEVLLVFDEVSRMSRNAEEGFNLYQELFNLGVNIEFLKDKHINTDVYRKALNTDIPMTGTNVDIILEAVKKYLMLLAKEQIQLGFQKAQDEIDYLHKRTSEGLLTAKLNGKQVGRIKGKKYTTKKEISCKEIILKNSKDFNGSNTDDEVMKLCGGIARGSYYKYKKELREQV